MLPDPLHPAVVHLPIALAVVIPIVALFALLGPRFGLAPARGWAFVVLLQLLLVGGAWLALETGEAQEERVEKVVAERLIDEHADAAEWMLGTAAVALLAIGAGLAPGRIGDAARPLGLALSLVVLAVAVRVGHLGGGLVYQHGAASAYTKGAAPAESAPR